MTVYDLKTGKKLVNINLGRTAWIHPVPDEKTKKYRIHITIGKKTFVGDVEEVE
jgi:hypothetical protein